MLPSYLSGNTVTIYSPGPNIVFRVVPAVFLINIDAEFLKLADVIVFIWILASVIDESTNSAVLTELFAIFDNTIALSIIFSVDIILLANLAPVTEESTKVNDARAPAGVALSKLIVEVPTK